MQFFIFRSSHFFAFEVMVSGSSVDKLALVLSLLYFDCIW